MNLPLQNFTTLLENMSASLQGSATQLVDVSVGSVMRALLEASASVALWMQWLILQVLGMTRAATSMGSDLDSWMADFSLVRLPGVSSTGIVVFGRYTLGVATTVPVGAIVKSTDGLLSFLVVADSSNPAWNGVSGYVLGPTAATLPLPAEASNPGASGNILGGSIGLLGSAIPGIDFVTNPTAFTGGIDAESDSALRSRFQLYINSRSQATLEAVGFAVQTLGQNLRYTILDNVNLLGDVAPGNFCVIVDDGTGAVADSVILNVNSVVDNIRPLGSTYSVSRPIILPVTVQMALRVASGSMTPTLVPCIQQSITSWINGLPIGGTLAMSKLEAIAHDADASVLSVSSASINQSTADIQAGPGTVIRADAVTITVS